MRKNFRNVILFLRFNEQAEHFDIRRHRNKIYDDRAAITRLTFAQLRFFYDADTYRYRTASIVNVFITCCVKKHGASCRDIKENRRMYSCVSIKQS